MEFALSRQSYEFLQDGARILDDRTYFSYMAATLSTSAPRRLKAGKTTVPVKSFNVMMRLYGLLEPWFDKNWKSGDFELVA
ncbi:MULTISPECIES: hypothetical protein [Halocynthiibacter]|uniref:Uncharacterized protein n=1 Tax=Halocynthiibacter halioticoli TaxID=2986804 RepID=A0AAE3LUK7_9RHOB|nr:MULTISPECIES: hypothetical protein [Halocynthiibacter]MCV6824565.1 hypothetical protein [Halocynthiibacter halioticoli]MCW4057566.1 hypothetical protein [Halocynthiibacter sp. SDUM655004]